MICILLCYQLSFIIDTFPKDGIWIIQFTPKIFYCCEFYQKIHNIFFCLLIVLNFSSVSLDVYSFTYKEEDGVIFNLLFQTYSIRCKVSLCFTEPFIHPSLFIVCRRRTLIFHLFLTSFNQDPNRRGRTMLDRGRLEARHGGHGRVTQAGVRANILWLGSGGRTIKT